MQNLAIVILGGSLIKDSQCGWRTLYYHEGDAHGITGDKLRVIAGSYLCRENQAAVIIASGGKGQLKNIPDAPTVSEVIKKELIDLGVEANKIIEENCSNNTWQQLQNLKKIVKERGIKNLFLISNEWQLERIKAMIEKDTELSQILLQGLLRLSSAEEICIRYKPTEWQEIIDKSRKSEAYTKRIEIENRGVKDIKEGGYQLK